MTPSPFLLSHHITVLPRCQGSLSGEMPSPRTQPIIIDSSQDVVPHQVLCNPTSGSSPLLLLLPLPLPLP